MQNVPIIDKPSQIVNATLGGQATTVRIYQRQTGLYVDVLVNDALIIGGVIVENLNRIVRDAYLGFIGDFVFFDTAGVADPTTPGLGTRYLLVYLDAADLPA